MIVEQNRIPAFREDKCDLCGLCFYKCPMLKLPLEEARCEIKNLIEGNESKIVLSKYNTYFSCNLYCPHEANPYQLILERWNDLNKQRGAPPLYLSTFILGKTYLTSVVSIIR